MQYIAVMPHDNTPNHQLALWTMYVNWEPRVFFRVVPGSTYDEVIRTFICHSNHWSDKLILLENKKYEVQELNALMQAPLNMQSRSKGLQFMGFPDDRTMIIRRDVFDVFERGGIRDNWFEHQFDMLELARRAGCRTAVYEEAEDKDGSIQESTQGGDSGGGGEWPFAKGDTTGVPVQLPFIRI